MAEYDIAYNSVEHGIAQELQPLVIQRAPFLVALSDALVHQCLLVQLDITRVETKDMV